MRLLQISAYALAGGLAIGLVAFGIAGGWFELDLQANGARLGFIAAILAVIGVTTYLHRRGSRFANGGKVMLAFVGLCVFIHYLSNMFPDESLIDRLVAQERPSILETVSYYFGLTWATLATVVSVLAMTFLLKRLFGEVPSTQGAPSDIGRRSRWLLTLAILLTWGIVETLFGTVLPSLTDKLRDLQVIEYVPFLVALLLTASLRKERWVVDGQGVKFLLGTRSIFCAKWRRIQRIVVMHKNGREDSLIVHYRGLLGMPVSLTFRPALVESGIKIAETIRGAAMEEGLAVVHMRQSRPIIAAGWVCVLIGLAFVPIAELYEISVNQRFIDGQITSANFDQLAAVWPLTALYLIPIALISLGFGLQSGNRVGGSRIILLAIWIIGIQFLPTPMLNWLVWSAIYAIDAATMSPNGIRYAAPYAPGLELAYDVVLWGFVLAPIFFWIGVALGRRKWSAEASVAWAGSPCIAQASREPVGRTETPPTDSLLRAGSPCHLSSEIETI